MYFYSDPNERDNNLKREAALLFGLKFQKQNFEDMEKTIKLISEKCWMVRHYHVISSI